MLVGLTIFAGEKIQDLTPLAANAILILGQGNMWFLHLELLCLEKCWTSNDLVNQVLPIVYKLKFYIETGGSLIS